MRARLINADGSEAEISGNGTRCVAAYMVSNGHAGKLAIRTGAGVKHCELVAREGHRLEFEMEMGEPRVDDAFSITVAFGQVHGTPVSMGNPHYVVFVKEFSPAWQAEGAEIGRHRGFKDGVNVEFVRVQGANDVEVRCEFAGQGACSGRHAGGALDRPQCLSARAGAVDLPGRFSWLARMLSSLRHCGGATRSG
jgi:diaminopimelate epimerase